MKTGNLQRIMLFFLMITAKISSDLFSSEGETLYTKGRYTIKKKNLMSYYLASPDLYVKTDKGKVKINLGGYSNKNRIAQEKISSVEINEISNDSIQIHFTSNDTASNTIKSQIINLNVKYALDSILSGK